MESFACACTVKDGKLKLFNLDMFNRALYAMPDGLDLELIIQEVGKQRTSAQNRFFHGPVLRAFMDLGYRKQEAKDMLCLRFIPREVKTMDGEVVTVPGHTSELKVKEFNELIESCIQLAAENDIYIKDAQEWRLEHAPETVLTEGRY